MKNKYRVDVNFRNEDEVESKNYRNSSNIKSFQLSRKMSTDSPFISPSMKMKPRKMSQEFNLSIVKRPGRIKNSLLMGDRNYELKKNLA